jgi:membrane protease YdiL (CAAX protease family)
MTKHNKKNLVTKKTEAPLKLIDRVFGSILIVFSSIVAFFGGQLGGGLLTVLVLSFAYKPEEIRGVLNSNIPAQAAIVILVEVTTVAIVYGLLSLRSLKVTDELQLQKRPSKLVIYDALLTFGLYFLASFGVIMLLSVMLPSIDINQEQQIGFETTTIATLPLVFLCLVIAVPIGEEVLFRGYLYKGLEKFTNSYYLSSMITSIVFGVAHLELWSASGAPNWIAGVDTLVFSWFLVWAYKKEKSLWTPIVMHCIKNFLAFITIFAIPLIRG